MEVRKSEKCGFHLKHSNFLVGFRCLQWRMSPSFRGVWLNIILFSGRKKCRKFIHLLTLMFSFGRAFIAKPGWLHSSRSRCFTSPSPAPPNFPSWIEPWKTAQKRLVRGFVWGMKSYPDMWGLFHKLWNKDPVIFTNQDLNGKYPAGFFFMAQSLPTFSELRNHITHVLNCCELGDLETQWEDFLLRSIPKNCYPRWRKKTSWYLPLKREKKGNHFLGSGCCVT